MSDDEIVAGPSGMTSTVEVSMPDIKPKYRSWRKKYRKMKTRFDDVMKDSTNLFVDEQKLEALSKRLQEQNDQILDLLLDLNSTLSVPHELRYNLSTEASTQEESDMTLDMANSIIKNAYTAVQNDGYPQCDFVKIRQEVESVLARNNSVNLSDLERRIAHPEYPVDVNELSHAAFGSSAHSQPAFLTSAHSQPAFLTSAHEDEYLARMDQKLGNPLPLSQPRATSPTALNKLTQRELDRQVELRNPLSVHNWLKKHGTVADMDAATESPGAAAHTPATINKRRNLAKKVGDKAVERAREREEGSPVSTQEQEEETVVDDTPGKKQKPRDDDQTYRPKGGRSTKSKRKREDLLEHPSPAAGRGKKAKTSNIAPVET